MLTFEITAIDIILVIAVIVLMILYWAKLSKIPDKELFKGSIVKEIKKEKIAANPQNDYSECPRGFGYIRKIGDDGSVSERCLGCYRIMDCYGEQEKIKSQLNQI